MQHSWRGVAAALGGSFMALSAIAETVTVTPGPGYEAGAFHRFLFGDHYRDLWKTPITVEVLDLRSTAGGLTPTKRGGGQQTRSLRFAGRDGREYVVRSVDKDPEKILPPELRETVAARIVRDQTSASLPGAALVVGKLLAAVSVEHAEPRLVVLPDDPGLGAFRKEFAGMLGLFEERQTSRDPEEDEPGREVVSSDKLLDLLEKSPKDRVDTRAFLKARLMDAFLGDWDRHRDQWRFTRGAPGETFRPIPRDRDQAFSNYDGLLLAIARNYVFQLVRFGEEYPDVTGLTWNGQVLDRRLLSDLPRSAWRELATELRGELTDAVIEDAVAALPRELRERGSAPLARALKSRRDALPAFAERFYLLLAREVDVHLTDKPERVLVTRPLQGGMRVQATAGKDGAVTFDRVFVATETREVRLYLHGGDDVVTVSPDVRGLRVRVVGGGGDDTVEDPAGRVRVYDARGSNRHVGPDPSIDARPYELTRDEQARTAPPRDWGSLLRPSPWLSFSPDTGLLLGGGPVLYDYGFRKRPYAAKLSAKAAYATAPGRFSLELFGDLTREGSRLHGTVLAKASGLEVLRFYGFGNETEAPKDDDFYRVEERRLGVQAQLVIPVGTSGSLAVGPFASRSTTDTDDRPRLVDALAPYGSGTFAEVGLAASAVLDTRDRAAAASRGVFARLSAQVLPQALDVARTYGVVSGDVSTYRSLPAPLQPVLALRAGGRVTLGDAPYQQAATLGGASDVRGLPDRRFAGDAEVHGNAELRFFVARYFLVLPGELGFFLLGDGGRVFLAGETSSRWHGSWGGGVWLAPLARENTITIAIARSEERTGVYVRAGFLF